MTDANHIGTALLLGLIVVTATAAAPLATARPAHEIPVSPATGDLSTPAADGWESVPAADVPLTSAPSSVPNADDTTIEQVHVQAARGDGTLYLRLQWADATRDRSAASPEAFADQVAVQFPVNASSRPPIAMGGPGNMVNVWYWSADAGTQELLAGGVGSTTAFDQPAVQAEASYDDGTWSVVYARSVDASGDNRTTITDDGDLDVAFAVWNGSNGERAGQKSVSEWHYFPFGEGPQGPPYQALLWSVAGVAIVAVIGVTAFGIHRTRGGMN
ncbi:ethylbenzene dehydrogenase-related protein [Haloarcula sp. GH36]|uniref:ethylbenzene dehydrogenase-related protein n=1 Tax=Haloarcula montana TaxID=3111776 RepID=UPI002D79033A|nr:ethylbenzene dehydrogenase-related protein [Haloarcula sp. GH36]